MYVDVFNRIGYIVCGVHCTKSMYVVYELRWGCIFLTSTYMYLVMVIGRTCPRVGLEASG